jgi:hypothetical protein
MLVKPKDIASIEKGYTFIKGGTGLGLRDTYLEV